MPLDPSAISGLKLWLESSTANVGGVADGGVITTWSDISGVGNDVTQATTALKPKWENSLATLNALPSVLFDGDGDTNADRLSANILNLSGKTGLTIFAVVQATNMPTVGASSIIARDIAADRGWAIGATGSTLGVGRGRLLMTVASSAAARTRRDGDKIDIRGLPCVVTGRFIGSTEISLRVNAADDNGAIDAAVPATIANDGGVICHVGFNGFSDEWGGYISELLVYDDDLSDADRLAVEAYLMIKYDLIGLEEASTGPNTEAHQGYSYDPVGDKHYVFDTGAIERRTDDGSWTVEATNSSPFTGLSGTVNHVGDGHYYDGDLYVPVTNWTNCGTNSNGQLAIYDASTLALVDSFSIATETAGAGSTCVVVPEHGADGIIWVAEFCTGTTLYQYGLLTQTLAGTLTLSETITGIQGLAFKDGWLYIGTNNGRIFRCNPSTGAVKMVYRSSLNDLGDHAHEGLDYNGDTLAWLIDEDTTSATADKFVHFLTLFEPASVSVTTGLGEGSGTGFAPTVIPVHVEVEAGLGTGSGLGFAPTVTAGVSVNVTVGLGTGSGTGFAPTMVSYGTLQDTMVFSEQMRLRDGYLAVSFRDRVRTARGDE